MHFLIKLKLMWLLSDNWNLSSVKVSVDFSFCLLFGVRDQTQDLVKGQQVPLSYPSPSLADVSTPE